jgi:biofilm PGA synthesis lipoprotein PgaB
MTRFDDATLAWLREPRRPVRAAQVDLDALWDPSDAVFRRRIDRVIDELRSTGATHVFLQACPDLTGEGRVAQAWFMNHQIPVRADVWSMVAAKLAQARIQVWVRAPSMNLSWEWERHPEWRMPFRPTGRAGEKDPWYFRLSPNLPEARRAAVDFYTDLAVYLPIAGVLFDDDAYMLPGESLNGDTLTTSAAKAAAIDGLLAEIKRGVRAWRPGCRFARNLYAPVVERSGVHPGFAQDYERSLRDDDLSVVMAYARMEGHERDAERWTESLARTATRRAARVAAASPRGRPLLKLQAYDWASESWVPAEELAGCARAARRGGVSDLGLYPLLPDQPNLTARLFESGSRPEFSASDSSQR